MSNYGIQAVPFQQLVKNGIISSKKKGIYPRKLTAGYPKMMGLGKGDSF